MSKNYINPTKVITGLNTRWSYANVWEAKSINGGTPKFSVSLIIPKDDTVTVNKIKAAIQSAYEEGQSKLKGSGKTVPALSVLKTPMRDGDLERPDDEAYANSYFINAKVDDLEKLIKAISSGRMLTEYEDELFLAHVAGITVLSREEIVFELKCGLRLKERLVG